MSSRASDWAAIKRSTNANGPATLYSAPDHWRWWFLTVECGTVWRKPLVRVGEHRGFRVFREASTCTGIATKYHGCGSHRGRQDSIITHCGLLWHCYVNRKSVGMYKALRAKPELSFRGCLQFQSREDVTRSSVSGWIVSLLRYPIRAVIEFFTAPLFFCLPTPPDISN
jgi:hypothetical protein